MADSKLRSKRIRAKNKTNRKKERQDSLGISREKVIHKFDFKLFCILKIIAIVCIPILYFVYSSLVIVPLIGFIVLFFLSFRVEKTMNRSIIKSNHVKFPKYDTAFALIVIVIAIIGASFGLSGNNSNPFSHNTSKITTTLQNFGSALTGTRTLIGNNRNFKFSVGEPPENFIANKEDFRAMMGDRSETANGFSGMPPGDIEMKNFDMGDFGGGMGGRFNKGEFELSVDDLPIEYMFSSILSSVNTVLIFATSITGALTLLYTILKKKRFDKDMKEVVYDNGPSILSIDEISKILSYNEELLDAPEDGIDYYVENNDDKKDSDNDI